MCSGLILSGSFRATTSQNPCRAATVWTIWSRLARRAGLTETDAVPLTDFASSSAVLLARAPLRLVDAPQPALDCVDLLAELLSADPADGTFGLPEAGLTILRSDGSVPRLVALFARGEPHADPLARTAARILALQNLAPVAAAEGRRLVALVPGGSGQKAAKWTPARPASGRFCAPWRTNIRRCRWSATISRPTCHPGLRQLPWRDKRQIREAKPRFCSQARRCGFRAARGSWHRPSRCSA